jgi:hypothetical protein
LTLNNVVDSKLLVSQLGIRRPGLGCCVTSGWCGGLKWPQPGAWHPGLQSESVSVPTLQRPHWHWQAGTGKWPLMMDIGHDHRHGKSHPLAACAGLRAGDRGHRPKLPGGARRGGGRRPRGLANLPGPGLDRAGAGRCCVLAGQVPFSPRAVGKGAVRARGPQAAWEGSLLNRHCRRLCGLFWPLARWRLACSLSLRTSESSL